MLLTEKGDEIYELTMGFYNVEIFGDWQEQGQWSIDG